MTFSLDAFLARIDTLRGSAREKVILEVCASPEALESPPWPSWTFGNWATIQTSFAGRTIVFQVSRDYFSVGTDEKSFVLPMWPGTAQAIGDHRGAGLLTARMVDLIYQDPQARRLYAHELDGDHCATGHYRTIDGKTRADLLRLGYSATKNLLVGHRKDIVLSSLLPGKKDNRMAIYGWHGLSGKPIQDLNPWSHDDGYVDYSHGWRPVHPIALVDGTPTKILSLLQDPVLAVALTGPKEKCHEGGPLTFLHYPNRLASRA